ncbi:MAG: type II toxin-antitoxin system HicA family toxin [Oscillospiraceae bacterium]|nr:type II toxin-antitoxin system HicA family toxin [Oscillospiraceae bacterium]
MNKRKFLQSIINGQKNVRYTDFVALLKSFDFVLTRSDGSHNIFKRHGISEFLNIQNVNGEAKPYQIRQFLQIVEKNNLKLGDD